MDLQTCTDQVKFTQNQYTAFHTAVSGISSQVKKSTMKLQSIDVITNNIQADEANFQTQIQNIQELYNSLAVRSNALGRWMSEEKMLRDNLQELYRELVDKAKEEEASLVILTKTVRDALLRLSSLEKEMSETMSLIASAQKAMYGWAGQVTVSVNAHTTKLGSLTQALQYRVAQIDKTLPEMREVANRAVHIARGLGETNAATVAAASLNQVQAVIDNGSVTSGSQVLSVPSSS
jgi:chromosome segregation ATPase